MEVGRSVQGAVFPMTCTYRLWLGRLTRRSLMDFAAVAYVPVALFAEYKYLPWSSDAADADDDGSQQQQQQAVDNNGDETSMLLPETCVEIHLDTLITCLEIFGSGKVSSLASQDRSRRAGGGGGDDSFEALSFSKTTALRLEYQAPGEPLLLLCVGIASLIDLEVGA